MGEEKRGYTLPQERECAAQGEPNRHSQKAGKDTQEGSTPQTRTLTVVPHESERTWPAASAPETTTPRAAGRSDQNKRHMKGERRSEGIPSGTHTRRLHRDPRQHSTRGADTRGTHPDN